MSLVLFLWEVLFYLLANGSEMCVSVQHFPHRRLQVPVFFTVFSADSRIACFRISHSQLILSVLVRQLLPLSFSDSMLSGWLDSGIESALNQFWSSSRYTAQSPKSRMSYIRLFLEACAALSQTSVQPVHGRLQRQRQGMICTYGRWSTMVFAPECSRFGSGELCHGISKCTFAWRVAGPLPLPRLGHSLERIEPVVIRCRSGCLTQIIRSVLLSRS